MICANCSQPIRPDAGGWFHSETGAEQCAMAFYAIPEVAS